MLLAARLIIVTHDTKLAVLYETVSYATHILVQHGVSRGRAEVSLERHPRQTVSIPSGPYLNMD